jgi:hypothetical protein
MQTRSKQASQAHYHNGRHYQAIRLIKDPAGLNSSQITSCWGDNTEPAARNGTKPDVEPRHDVTTDKNDTLNDSSK